MKVHPAVGDFYRQEFDLRNAEDFAEVMSLDESVTAGGVGYNQLPENLGDDAARARPDREQVLRTGRRQRLDGRRDHG